MKHLSNKLKYFILSRRSTHKSLIDMCKDKRKTLFENK